MKFLSQLFDNNRKWVAEIKRKDPEYLSKIQKPEYL
jgi:carbonic anhydrase